MTTILIPREPVPVSLTADQVVAYLLRPGSGRVARVVLDADEWWSWNARRLSNRVAPRAPEVE